MQESVLRKTYHIKLRSPIYFHPNTRTGKRKVTVTHHTLVTLSTSEVIRTRAGASFLVTNTGERMRGAAAR